MTTVRLVPPPQSVLDTTGKVLGFWYRFQDTHAYALLHWAGGPRSPDKDVIIHDIEAIPERQGHGTALLKEILWWVDQRGLTAKLLATDTYVQDWFASNGFLRIRPLMGGVEMIRQPRGGLVLPG